MSRTAAQPRPHRRAHAMLGTAPDRFKPPSKLLETHLPRSRPGNRRDLPGSRKPTIAFSPRVEFSPARSGERE
jgi:hypothetical protein